MKRSTLSVGLSVGVFLLGKIVQVTAQPIDNDPLDRNALSGVIMDAPSAVGAKSPVPAPPPMAQPERGGNPLRGTPIERLAATRERPIFSPSRRPPPIVAAAPYVPPRSPAKPASPQLTLLGTVLGSAEDTRTASAADGIGVFLDEANNAVVRLKTGDYHNGWLLRSVQGREATLQKDRETVVLALPTRGTEPGLGIRPALANVSGIESTADPHGTPSLKLLFDQYH